MLRTNWTVGHSVGAAVVLVLVLGGAQACLAEEGSGTGGRSFTISAHDALVEPLVRAYLYSPALDEDEAEGRKAPMRRPLVLTGAGFEDGSSALVYRVEGEEDVLHEGEAAVTVTYGRFEVEVEPEQPLPDATKVSWELRAGEGPSASGTAALRWSRFSGRVTHEEAPEHKTQAMSIIMLPVTWGAPGELIIPVGQDGSFDAMVPARVYGALIVVDTGYGGTSLERWAWDYDLTRDREDVFTIGRTELYGMRAFEILGGPPTIFVGFRPSSLTRALRFDDDGDGVIRGNEESMAAALKESPTALAPELTAEDVKVWLNGQEQKVRQLDMLPECDGDYWQAYYIVQIYTGRRVERGVWHELKVEVRSTEKLGDEERVDFGQGSVGFFRP
jgi:hypothetical protein